MNCGICGDDQATKMELGCESSTQMPVWADEEDRYFNCPISFIPRNVEYWYEEFSYMQTFQTPVPKFGKMPNKFIEAMHCYNNWCKRYSDDKPKSGTNDTLNTLSINKGK